MKQITFENIFIQGHIVFENEHYKHFHYPEMLIRYDSNFIDFIRLPSLTEFKDAADYLRNFHLKNGQKHVKFTFPANEKLSDELTKYMGESGYSIGFHELYAIQPNQFPQVRDNSDIEIQVVTDENFEEFLKLQYQQDLDFGSEFADQKVDQHRRNFQDPSIVQVLALYKGTPAGSVDIILTQETAEIDGLVVDETFQKRGIGSRLQQFAMNQFLDKTVILVADGEDTPKKMYRKQNYQYLGFKYNAQKVYED